VASRLRDTQQLIDALVGMGGEADFVSVHSAVDARLTELLATPSPSADVLATETDQCRFDLPADLRRAIERHGVVRVRCRHRARRTDWRCSSDSNGYQVDEAPAEAKSDAAAPTEGDADAGVVSPARVPDEIGAAAPEVAEPAPPVVAVVADVAVVSHVLGSPPPELARPTRRLADILYPRDAVRATVASEPWCALPRSDVWDGRSRSRWRILIPLCQPTCSSHGRFRRQSCARCRRLRLRCRCPCRHHHRLPAMLCATLLTDHVCLTYSGGRIWIC
jgi:hypothetical protein